MELKAGSCFIWSIVQVLHSLESKRLLDLLFAGIRVSLVCALKCLPTKTPTLCRSERNDINTSLSLFWEPYVVRFCLTSRFGEYELSVKNSYCPNGLHNRCNDDGDNDDDDDYCYF